MGRDSSRSGESQDAEAGSTADATETTQAAASMGPSESLLEQVGMSGASGSTGPDVRGQASPAQYEAYYGVEIDAPGEVARLQRLEESNTLQQVREWGDEGMPVAAMGEILKMEAFQERKGTPVPWDAEQRNEKSKRRNTSPIQRATHGSPAGETDTPESVREVLSSPGQSLDASIQRAMEDRMGDSLGDVRIHTGPKAAKACEDINAKAFTVGNHVAFNHGEYDPESPEGQHVLAHELAHVRQQTDAAVSMLPQDDVELEIDPDPQLEREAEETAQRVLAGGDLGIQRLGQTEVHLQRYPGHDRVKQARREITERLQDQDSPEVSSDPEALAKEVEAIKERQQHMMATLTEAQPGANTDGNWATAATKGVMGSLAQFGSGIAVGAAAGSFLPGPGTLVGAAAGAAVSGAVGDLAKEGVGFMAANRAGGQADELEEMYREMREMYEEMSDEGTDTGSVSAEVDY